MSKDNAVAAEWKPVAITDEEALVQLAAPYVHWYSPDLVAELAADNTAHRVAWQAVLVKGNVKPDLYLWPGSACAYPGRRRKTGKEPAGKPATQCLATDTSGNHHAHCVWELLSAKPKDFIRLRPNYELVHLFPHKASEWQKLLKLLDKHDAKLTADLPSDWRDYLEQYGLPGLFTNPANMCFVPNTFVRPTDGDSLFRKLLWKRALHLFRHDALLPQPIANVLANWLAALPEPASLRWNTDYYGDPKHLPKLLAARKQFLQKA